MPIRQRASEFPLRGEHARHVILLEAVKMAAIEEREQNARHQVEAGCGAGEAANRIAKAIDPCEGYVVLTSDQRGLVPNPKLFEPLSLEGLSEFEAAYYQASLATQGWCLGQIVAGNPLVY